MAEISTEVSFKLLCNVQDYLGTFSLMIIIIIIIRNILGTFSVMIIIIIIFIGTFTKSKIGSRAP